MNATPPPRPGKIAIVGGGVIGLSIGWRLAAAGCAVEIFERGAAGHGASWAAAGMLAAGSEVEPGERVLFGLLKHSQSLWPGFAAELAEASGIDVELRTEGTISVALSQDELGRLRQTYALQQQLGVNSRWLGRAELLEREPHLNPRLAGAILVPGDFQVENRMLVEALKLAFARAGGVLRENVGDVAVRTGTDRAVGVTAGGSDYTAETVIVAAGAWTPDVAGLPAAACPPVRPVKGQMMAVRMDPAAPILNHVLWTQKAYLVPRLDGRLLIGATTEERGFDTSLTAGGMLSLLESAWRALPGIEELPIIESWVGFRPGSRDDAPILGGTAIEGLVLATGHHRNGILLTPITADAIAGLVMTGETDPAIARFGLARFGPHEFERTKSWISA
ncbi:MAG: thiO [Rhodospirillales bacterium]|nr:thiO [Rhodospirillales bacterium]